MCFGDTEMVDINMLYGMSRTCYNIAVRMNVEFKFYGVSVHFTCAIVVRKSISAHKKILPVYSTESKLSLMSFLEQNKKVLRRSFHFHIKYSFITYLVPFIIQTWWWIYLFYFHSSHPPYLMCMLVHILLNIIMFHLFSNIQTNIILFCIFLSPFIIHTKYKFCFLSAQNFSTLHTQAYYDVALCCECCLLDFVWNGSDGDT